MTGKSGAMSSPSERREYVRQSGHHYPLRIGRHAARLLDWSERGVGIVVREGVEAFRAGDRVSIAIHSEQTHAVVVVRGQIQHVDPASKVAAVMFDDNGQVVPLLVDLVGAVGVGGEGT